MANSTPETQLDRIHLVEEFGRYTPPPSSGDLPNIPFVGVPTPSLGTVDNNMSLEDRLLAENSSDKITGGSIPRTYAEVLNPRYPVYVPGDYNNEDAYGRGQWFASKMVNAVGKGLSLAGTTFLNGTAGMIYGGFKWKEDGKFSSFYNNEFTRALDRLNVNLDNNILPNYYTDAERNAPWYSPTKWFTANFLWDSVVKNLGFAAGAALSGGVYAKGLQYMSRGLGMLPGVGKLFSIGKGAEVAAAVESGVAEATAAGRLANTYGKVKSVSDRFLGSYNALNPAGRYIVAGLATSGEASMEALQNLNQYRDGLIEQYRENNFGEYPTGKALEDINRQAESVGNSSFLLNSALLSMTNYIQFPRILGSSYTAEKGIANSLTKEIGEIVEEGGKFVAKQGRKGILGTLNKIRPYLFSTSEAFEEGSQYAITIGTQDYYEKKSNGETANIIDSLAEGVKETLGTDEGMMNVLIGGLSGAIMLGVGADIMGRGPRQERREKDKNTKEAIEQLNKYRLSDFTKETFDSVSRGTLLQQEKERAVKDGRILDAKDLEQDYIINYLTPRIKYGRYDLVSSEINEYRQLASTEEGFLQLQREGRTLPNDTREAFIKRIDQLAQTANNVKSLYQTLNLRYAGIVDEKGNAKYSPVVIDKMVYAASKIADYDQRITSLSPKLLGATIDVGQVMSDLVQGKVEKFNEAVEKIKNLNVIDEEKTTLGEALNDIGEMTLRRSKFLQEYTEIKNNPEKFNEVKAAPVVEGPEDKTEKKPTVTVKTKTGEKEVEIGTQYYVGKTVSYNEKGERETRPNWITILKDNGDGTLQIKDKTGTIRDIKASVLADYRLGKVSVAKADPTVSFYMRNWDKKITRKIKGGARQEGWLEHDPDTNQLFFVHRVKDRKGFKEERIPITTDLFEPKQGYLEGVYSHGGPLTKEDQADIQEAKDILNTPEKAIIYEMNSREGRKQMISDLYEELRNRQERTTKLIEQKKNDVRIIEEDIADLTKKIESTKSPTRETKTKGIRFKSTVRNFIEAANRLSRAKEDIEREIADLESENERLDSILSYFEDFSQNIRELPIDTREALYELGYEVELLKETIETTTKQISALTRVMDGIESTLKSISDFIVDLTNDFFKVFPNIPTTTIAGFEWKEFYNRYKHPSAVAPKAFLNLSELEGVISIIEDTEIKPNQDKLNEAKSELEQLKSSLKTYEGELRAKMVLLAKFQKAYDDYKSAEVEESRLKNEPAIIKAALGTEDKGNVETKNVDKNENFEPMAKKATDMLWRATMGIIRGNKPHQIRANKFGFNLNKFENRSNIRGVYVTAKNEHLLGLTGLVDFIASSADETIDKDQVIALVMVDVSGETPVVVNENGEAVTENLLDNVIFQVFPKKELEWSEKYGGDSMFRKGTPEHEIETVKKYYSEFRDRVIKDAATHKDVAEMSFHTVGSSFGFPTYKQILDENNNPVKNKEGRVVLDYSVRTSAEDAGLITEGDLDREVLIYVPTLEEGEVVANGTTSYRSEKGRPFLRTPNGDVPLQNRKHTKEEASVIFDVILQLAKNMTTPGVGLLDKKTGKINDKCSPLIEWLKSVVYWGLPANEAGWNSIFFEKTKEGKFVLRLSGKEFAVPFTPSALEDNRGVILGIIEGMYGNVNVSKVRETGEPYTEILSVGEDGGLSTRRWLNYQSYLLSNKFVAEDEKNNEKARGEIPLTTIILPLKSKDDVNRTGIYFFTEDNKNEVITEAPEKIRAGKPKKTQPADKYVLDGRTENTIVGKEGRKLTFVATPTGEITITAGGDSAKIVEDLKKSIQEKNKNFTPKQVNDAVRNTLKSYISKEIAPFVKAKEETEEDERFSAEDLGVKPEEKTPVAEEPEDERFSMNDLNAADSKADEIINSVEEESDDEGYRVIREEQEQKFEKEDWPKVEQWLRKNFPNIPIYRVKNIIQATNGQQAWGMFKDGAIYVYENAEVGTVYHEVFEGVWKMFSSPAEQEAIINEFRSRKGSFTDRPTGASVKYSEATAQQIKEQLAEEFRDYVQNRKIPFKPEKGKPYILKLFSDLITFIREFFFKSPSKVEDMFKNISSGYYKDKIPYQTNLSFLQRGIIDIDEAFATPDAELRVNTITDKQRSEVLESMTYYTLFDLIEKDDSLFGLEEHITRNKSVLYNTLQEKILKDVARVYGAEGKPLIKNIILQWDEIIKRHAEYLKQYNIEFDENDELQITDEDKIRESDYVDANKVDHLKKANTAIKMLLATLPEMDVNTGKWKRSTVGGPKLIPISKAWVSLLKNLHSSRSVEEMMFKLREMGKNDINYRGLYRRLTKRDFSYEASSPEAIDLSHVQNQHSGRLLAAFYALFKKQNPEVKTVTIFENGEIAVGDTHLSTFASQMKEDYVNNIISTAKSGSKYFVYNAKGKTYVGNKEALSRVELPDIPSMVKFLGELGINFSKDIPAKFVNKFKESVLGIRKSIMDGSEIATFSGRVLNIHKRLMDLGYIQAHINNPEFDSTYFNVNGERTQTFIGTNPASDLFDNLSQVNNKSELSRSPFKYLLTDSFAQGSSILKRMFSRDGRKIETEEAQNLMRVVYISGTDNQQRNRKKQSSKLSYKERFVQELNLNAEGYYLNLVPGDASMEWAIYMGTPISEKNIKDGWDSINLVFRDYFISELDVVREADQRESSMAKKRNAKEMRFFKDILGEELHKRVLADSGETSEDVYNNNKSRIDTAVRNFITSQNRSLETTLRQYGILQVDENGNYTFENVNVASSSSQEELNNRLTFLNVNYIIANIELHKLLYADPYQYADELKRMKNFNSPRQALINNSPKMNAVLNRVWNKDFAKGEIGYTNFSRDYFKSTTYEDVMGIMEELPDYQEPWKETDGGGIISLNAYRNFRIRVGDWNDDMERQYKHDMGYERLIQDGATEEALLEYNKANPAVKAAYTPIKPIVSGSKKTSVNYNSILLDKFALYPMSRRLADDINRAGGKTTSTLVSLYGKMQNEGIDYIVFESSRKVGAQTLNKMYENGQFNMSLYPENSIIEVPFSIMSVQTEVPSKDSFLVTRGSQVTKLVTMDYMEAGVPIDFMKEDSNFSKRYSEWYKLTEDQKLSKSPLYKEIKHNQQLLEALIDEGYKEVLTRFGIEERYNSDKKQKEYILTDTSLVGETLRDEILKREVSDNISAALNAFVEGKSVLEATPAYHQIRNILYSIADKEVMSPKINGGMKVQIPSTALESVKAEEIEINGKKGYVSDTLDFYKKDGKQVCEIMIGRWFESDMSDAELLNYLNNTEEGKQILSGLAFRIPTQKQNSIESFVIKQFLPKEFGDSVVVPSAMVAKAGSDFDIDKLTIYLKNVLSGKNRKPKLIPYVGVGEEAKQKLSEMFDRGDFATEEEIQQVQNYIKKRRENPYEAGADAILQKLVGDEYDQMMLEGYIANTTNPEFKEWFINNLYKKSLQNGYIQSSQNLVSSPENFERLTKPNSADQLKDLGKFIAEKTSPEGAFDYQKVSNMLNRTFMSKLRHAFVTGKYAIGIAAVNQTNHSLNQRQLIYVDPEKIKNTMSDDIKWLGDGKLKFDKFNKIFVPGKGDVATLSMIRNAERNEQFPQGQDISDIISQFIDGYVDISKGPWIMELGATPNVTGTWLFLAKAGVPIDTIAYFMNQPIIRDYLRSIEVAGYSWLFMENFVSDIKDDYKSSYEGTINKIPNKTSLKEMVGKSASDLKENEQQKAEQQFILDEFLKYAKMAEHMFHVTQGSNFDTANFNDPYLVFKKFKQLQKAQLSIINNVDDLLANSFVGKLGETIKDLRNALATILKSDSRRVRKIIEQVLEPYVDMPDRDFTKLAQKAVNDLFDYAVQTTQNLNKDIRAILIEKGGVAAKLSKLMQDIAKDPLHPLYGNHIIGKDGILRALPSPRVGENVVNNIKIKGLQNKVYDQNLIIWAFRDIRDFLGNDNKLYDNIVELSILQSGLSNSNISFTSVIPYEDFEKQYHSTLTKLDEIANLENFVKLNVFQRNNWNNEDIVDTEKAKLITKNVKRPIYNPAMTFRYDRSHIQKAIDDNEIPQVMTVRKGDRRKNHIVYTWEKQNELLPENWRKLYPNMRDYEAVKEIKKQMRSIGDYSYINKGLFEIVLQSNGQPFETGYKNKKGEWVEQYVYKAINAWGDGRRANEFYDVEKQSVIDNGFIKVEGVDNNKIIAIFRKENFVETVTEEQGNIYEGTNPQYSGMTEFNKLPGKSATSTMTYAGIGSRQTPKEILNKMTAFAKKAQLLGYTLNTGVTFRGQKEGADKAFADGTTKVNLFSPEVHGSRLREQAIAKEVHPNPSALSLGGLKLMARNTNQVFGDKLDTPVDFVIFWAKETKGIRPEGGTGQAVEMARRKGIPTINMANPNWESELNKVIDSNKDEDWQNEDNSCPVPF